MVVSREFDSPAHRAHLRSYFTLPMNLEFNTALYYASRLRTMQIPAYLRADTGFDVEGNRVPRNRRLGPEPARRATPGNAWALRTEVRRSVIARVTWVLGGD
jgi:hypothetical protein